MTVHGNFATACNEALARSVQYAPFLQGLIAAHPDVVDALRSAGPDTALALALAIDAPSVAARLRRQRARLMLVVALADLSGAWPLEQVVAVLSDFADHALDTAIAEAIDRHVPGAAATGFAAIALGKHGSRELNYSSDIDPIFIYDPATLPRRAREDPAEAAVRIARRVVDLLQTRDVDGFAFRVDLRLRPAAEATPIALSIGGAITHYESSALPWERAAFIRARAAAGDTALGEHFLDTIRPFVWRRSLDFGAVGDLRALTKSIRQHYDGQMLGPGYDLKRGRGGIREIEFFAQIQQLIHGGRNADLRCGATIDALGALAHAGWLAPDDAVGFATAYRLLRTIEHRLQMVDDQQTHSLPNDPAAFDRVAQLHGLSDRSALLALLQPHVEMVGRAYDALDDEPATTSVDGVMALSGFNDAPAAAARIARWRAGSVRAIRSPAAVAAFEALLPDILADLVAAPDPDAALARLDTLIGRLSSGVNLFRLLDAQPAVRTMLVAILSHAPTLADALAQAPALLDRLLDQTALGPVPDTAALAAEMRFGPLEETERQLDRVRHIVSEYRFMLGTQIVAQAADPIDVAAGYGRVAEAAIDVLAGRVTADFESAHGKVPGAEFVIVALGRLGGGLLTHASDLDLIYLFTGDFAAESDGVRPLGATHYFNRLAQRVTGALSVPTSAGSLYDVDTRLRPSGKQGPLVVSVESFARYQMESAWTWEHMALTRVRTVFGSIAARRLVDDVVARTLNRPRDEHKLAIDVVAMRADVAAHKPPSGTLDVKLGEGGLVDLEFTVHFYQLARGIGLSPDLRVALGALADAGIATTEFARAHDLLTRMLVTLRLVAPALDVPDAASRSLVARACGFVDWVALLAGLAAARQCVTQHWLKVQQRAESGP